MSEVDGDLLRRMERVIAKYEEQIKALEHELERVRNPTSPPKGWII